MTIIGSFVAYISFRWDDRVFPNQIKFAITPIITFAVPIKDADVMEHDDESQQKTTNDEHRESDINRISLPTW